MFAKIHETNAVNAFMVFDSVFDIFICQLVWALQCSSGEINKLGINQSVSRAQQGRVNLYSMVTTTLIVKCHINCIDPVPTLLK